ncbi:hypothetical protein TPHA_0O00280 [Tetrapisispora phaffii CBS 4417]|uniref:Protein DOM34 homolog n=1 Tax=Tetrapisispora phaffii (strain ATCC 24235 / CBS 4417 / NBRC 1672 / NRRL Y-8282 / UCD 70-5) TaxID=1071381 RepID=G8C1H2_TETPH|nr:hypothetical protein TPHA_0O00280 [Tetrapisispora phaffii CBS 4417]CCE66000.1 hypothetical protein TPHA_0O00280 [Tetrapisispora phaffii CBS 4417]
MKLINLSEASGTSTEVSLTVLPEDKEDLFILYQIIKNDDEVFCRKMVSSKEDGRKKISEIMKLKLQIISNEFDMHSESLRYKGITVPDETGRANQNVSIGKYFSFNVVYQQSLTIIKDDFNSYERKLVEEACNVEGKADTAAVVLQEGVSHVCLLTESSTILKQKIEYSLPKKKRDTDTMKFDEKTEKFYKATYEAMKKNFDFNKLNLVILCSPAFYAKTLLEKVIKYAAEDDYTPIVENQNIFLVAHSSTGYLQGISEVLKNPNYSSKLSDTKYSKQAMIMDEFLLHLNDDDMKAWYGEKEVLKASELGAVDVLLITDSLLRSDDVSKRMLYIKLIEDIEDAGGSVQVVSVFHSTGEELAQLTGVACILRYPISDLDEGLYDDEQEEEED